MYACGGEDSSSTSHPLTTRNDAVYWTQNARTIPICFVEPEQLGGYPPDAPGHQVQYGQVGSEARQAFRHAAERSWQSVAWLDFTGFKTCPNADGGPNDRYVRYAITDGVGGVAAIGMDHFPAPGDPFNGDVPGGNIEYVGIGGNPPALPGTNQFGIVVAHELGHTAGFVHETNHPTNRDEAGDALVGPDGDLVWCAEGMDEPISAVRGISSSYDPHSVMSQTYNCPGAVYKGLTDLDISGLRSIYGVRPEGADSDHDKVSDLEDNCPYVFNDQQDSNLDAELAVSRSAHPEWSQSWPWEGRKPIPSDPPEYKQHWHDWYRGDACDKTAVVATRPKQATYHSHVQSGLGCIHITFGGVSSSSYDPNGSCPVAIEDGWLQQTGYRSSQTGFAPDVGGAYKPAACRCDVIKTNREACQESWGCRYGEDGAFPISSDNAPWFQVTTEREGNPNNWYASLVGQTSISFRAPVPERTLSTKDSFWNPFYPYAQQDIARLGVPGATSLSALYWTHVTFMPDGASWAENLNNNYVPLHAKIGPGVVFHWVPPFARKWRPGLWTRRFAGRKWGAINHMTFARTEAGSAIVVEQDEAGVSDVTTAFTPSALSALWLAAGGSAEILVADDHVASSNPGLAVPSALLLVPGTAQILGAFSATPAGVTYEAAHELPAQPSTTLRSYDADTGMLYSLESVANELQLVSRPIADALLGNPTQTAVPIGGALKQPLAAVWAAGQRRLLVLDSDGGSGSLRLFAVGLDGAAVELWRTLEAPALPSEAFLSLGGFGEIVISYNLGGGFEVISVRADDGQPLRSLRDSGALDGPATSDGYGFTLPRAQAPDENHPNMQLVYMARDAASVGVCGTSFFASLVGNQATRALGNPSMDCR